MIRHATRGQRPSLWVDDGYGNLIRINFDQIITRIVSGWGEL